jgi:hypothetical protein
VLSPCTGCATIHLHRSQRPDALGVSPFRRKECDRASLAKKWQREAQTSYNKERLNPVQENDRSTDDHNYTESHRPRKRARISPRPSIRPVKRLSGLAAAGHAHHSKNARNHERQCARFRRGSTRRIGRCKYREVSCCTALQGGIVRRERL